MMFNSNAAIGETSPHNQTESDVNSFLDRLRNYFTTIFLKFDVQSVLAWLEVV